MGGGLEQQMLILSFLLQVQGVGITHLGLLALDLPESLNQGTLRQLSQVSPGMDEPSCSHTWLATDSAFTYDVGQKMPSDLCYMDLCIRQLQYRSVLP